MSDIKFDQGITVATTAALAVFDPVTLTIWKREAEKAKREAERVEAAMRQMGLPAPVAPTNSEERHDTQELGKDLAALIHDRMQALEDRLTTLIKLRDESTRIWLKEELAAQRTDTLRELGKIGTLLIEQGSTTEGKLTAAIIPPGRVEQAQSVGAAGEEAAARAPRCVR